MSVLVLFIGKVCRREQDGNDGCERGDGEKYYSTTEDHL